MTAAYFYAAPSAAPFLPHALCDPRRASALPPVHWTLLILNRDGCRMLLSERVSCTCDTLLLPGEHTGAVTQLVQAKQVVSVGLSGRDSITCSSLRGNDVLLCVQRTLRRADGQPLEPQEFLFSCPPAIPPEEQLLLCGARLLLE